jgi:Mor family transcriptional regulator
MAEVAQVAGLEAVEWLCTHYGGESLSIPTRLRLHERLRLEDFRTGWLGDVARQHSVHLAAALVRLRAGEVVYIPSINILLGRARKRHIKRLYNGRNASELAAQFGVSRRMVRQIALERPRPKLS